MRTRFVKISSIETGLVATVSGASWSKMMSRSAIERSFSSQAHFQAMGHLDTLFRLATRVEQRPGDKPTMRPVSVRCISLWCRCHWMSRQCW